ncbi:MAG: dual specificity protein phosphatase family protein [bacterium]|nr:dual specificity protein phosphatase family protein [bacterium]
MKKNHVKMEYNQITPDIFLGTNMCCTMHYSKLNKIGLVADLSLEKEQHEHPKDLVYYLLLPVTDKFPPSLKQLRVGVKFIERVVLNKNKVYIHCKFGHGRSPTMLVAYFIAQGMGIDEAVALIKGRRPEIHLNQRQIKALQQYKKSLQVQL